MLDASTNPHEALARQRKAVALWALLRRANGGRPLAPESVLALDATAWQRAAQCARVNLPSAKAKAAVVELARLEATLSSDLLQREIESVRAELLGLVRSLIAAGRGHEPVGDTRYRIDPLSRQYRAARGRLDTLLAARGAV